MSKVSDEIKSKINIVEIIGDHISLSKKGQNHWAVCPFHDDTKPSLSVSEKKQLFKCFVCGVGGDVFQFLIRHLKINYQDALQMLAKKANVELENRQASIYTSKQKELLSVINDASLFFQNTLYTETGKKAFNYISKRISDKALIENFEIGYAPFSGLKEFLLAKNHNISNIINAGLLTLDEKSFFFNRLIFPIKNSYGDIVGFSGRTLADNQNKYINSPENSLFKKSEIIYNFSQARHEVGTSKSIYICEGFMDVIALSKAGINNAISIMGTALTNKHISLLKNLSINLFLDSDKAGLNASKKSILKLLQFRMKTQVISTTLAKDPDEIISKYGVNKLKEIISKPIQSLLFVYETLKPNLKSDSEKIDKFLKEFGIYLNYSTNLQKDMFVSKISEEFKLEKQTIWGYLDNFKKDSQSSDYLQNEKNTNLDTSNDDFPHYLIYLVSLNEEIFVPILKNWYQNLSKTEQEHAFKVGDLKILFDYIIGKTNLKSLSTELKMSPKEKWKAILNNFDLKFSNSLFKKILPQTESEFMALLNRYKMTYLNNEIDKGYNLKISTLSNDEENYEEKLKLLDEQIAHKRKKKNKDL